MTKKYLTITLGRHRAGIGPGLLVPELGNCNATPHEDFLFFDNCVISHFTVKVREITAHGCEGQVSANFWPHCIQSYSFHTPLCDKKTNVLSRLDSRITINRTRRHARPISWPPKKPIMTLITSSFHDVTSTWLVHTCASNGLRCLCISNNK